MEILAKSRPGAIGGANQRHSVACSVNWIFRSAKGLADMWLVVARAFHLEAYEREATFKGFGTSSTILRSSRSLLVVAMRSCTISLASDELHMRCQTMS